MNDYTNFHDYSHGDMRKMVQAMDSGGVMAASDPWRNAVKTLKDIRAALNTASADATSSWEGSTSDAFHSKMTTLANHVNTAAAYANDAAVSMQMMSEAIDTAKRDMPEEPGFWDEVGDGAKGFAESAVGMDNATTETSLADRKKDQAVAVMETLATKYRATTAYLKPPPPGNGWKDDDNRQISSDGSSPAEAISALIMGGGMGFAGANQAQGGSTAASRSSGPSLGGTTQSPKKEVAAPPTDSGIKGGTANAVSTPKSPTSFGPGTGLDGIQAGAPPACVGGNSLAIGGGGDVLAAEHGGMGGMPAGMGGGFGAGAAGRASSAFGAGGMEGGKGAGAGGKGGVAGRSGKGSFTEGGSGLGRGRGQGAHGMPGGSQAGKKDKKQGKERPDYLVEDEETWMSGEKANPNVVE